MSSYSGDYEQQYQEKKGYRGHEGNFFLFISLYIQDMNQSVLYN